MSNTISPSTSRPLPRRNYNRVSSRQTFLNRDANTFETRFTSLSKVTEPRFGNLTDKVTSFSRAKSDESLTRLSSSNISTAKTLNELAEQQNVLLRQIIDEIKNTDELNIGDFLRDLGGGAGGKGGSRRNSRTKPTPGGAQARGSKVLRILRPLIKPKVAAGVGAGLSAFEEFRETRDVGRAAVVGGSSFAGALAGGALGGLGGPIVGIFGSIIGGVLATEGARAAIESVVNPSMEALERGRAALQQGAGGPGVQSQMTRNALVNEIRTAAESNIITRNQANELNRMLLRGIPIEQVRTEFNRLKQRLQTPTSFNETPSDDAMAVDEEDVLPDSENLVDALMRSEFQEIEMKADRIEFDGKISIDSESTDGLLTPTSSLSGGLMSAMARLNGGENAQRIGGSRITNRIIGDTQAPLISGMDDVKAMIIRHEGIRYEPYQDSLGKWTIGVGHLIGDGSSPGPYAGRRLSHAEVMQLFEQDFANHVRIAEQTPGWSRANRTGQAAMIDLAFNMGMWWPNWPSTSRALEAGDWEAAAQGLENSRWYNQVGRRAPRIVNMIRGAGSGPSMQPGSEAASRLQQNPQSTPGNTLTSEGTDMTAADQARMRTGQQIIIVPGSNQNAPNQNPGQTSSVQVRGGEVPLRVRFETQVA